MVPRGMEGKGVSSGPRREKEEKEEESTAGFNPRTSGQPGGSVGAVAPISQDRLPVTATGKLGQAQRTRTKPTDRLQPVPNTNTGPDRRGDSSLTNSMDPMYI